MKKISLPNEKLKMARIKTGISQRKVERVIGAGQGCLSKWEKGQAFPGEYARYKLCEYYGMSSTELGLDEITIPSQEILDMHIEAQVEVPKLSAFPIFQEGVRNSENLQDGIENEPLVVASSQQSSPTDTTWGDFVQLPHFLHFFFSRTALLLCLVLVLATVSISPPVVLHSSPDRQAPFGGFWVSPTRGQTVHDIIPLAAYAASTKTTNLKVDHVTFTAWWPGVNPNQWKNLCVATTHDIHDIFTCKSNLHLFQAPAGNITISFDIYDSTNDMRASSGGEFTITYIPSSLLEVGLGSLQKSLIEV